MSHLRLCVDVVPNTSQPWWKHFDFIWMICRFCLVLIRYKYTAGSCRAENQANTLLCTLIILNEQNENNNCLHQNKNPMTRSIYDRKNPSECLCKTCWVSWASALWLKHLCRLPEQFHCEIPTEHQHSSSIIVPAVIAHISISDHLVSEGKCSAGANNLWKERKQAAAISRWHRNEACY